MRARNDRICSSDGFILDSVVWIVGDKNVGVTVVVVLGDEGKIGWSFVGTNNFSTTLLTSSSVSSLGGWVFWFWTAIFFLNNWSIKASSSGLAAAKMGAILPLLPFLIPSLQKENGIWETITLSKGNSIYSFFVMKYHFRMPIQNFCFTMKKDFFNATKRILTLRKGWTILSRLNFSLWSLKKNGRDVSNYNSHFIVMNH